MATIINNPPTQAPAPSDGGGSFAGIIIGIVLLVVVGFFLFAYGLPMLRETQSMNNTNSSPTINIPDTIDVNVKK